MVKYFTHGELFNIDRSWPILAETHELLKDYPHVVKQAIIKTPVKDEYLEFFQNCPVKYMYMPIVYNMEELRKVLTYDNINIVGVEAIAKTADSEMIDPENLKWIREQGLYIWVNSINLGRGHELSGTYNDDVALSEGPGCRMGRSDGSWIQCDPDRLAFPAGFLSGREIRRITDKKPDV